MKLEICHYICCGYLLLLNYGFRKAVLFGNFIVMLDSLLTAHFTDVSARGVNGPCLVEFLGQFKCSFTSWITVHM